MSRAWQTALEQFVGPGAVLVGIGNRLRGDDAFGPVLADRLRERIPWPVWDVGETPENYSGPIVELGPQRVLLLDAVAWGAAPGGLRFFTMETIPFRGISTHAMSLRLFAHMLSSAVPCGVALLGAEPTDLGMGAPLSPRMEESVREVEQHLLRLAQALKAKNVPA